MKKGQAEILGFMVIILLLFFGLLLYFRFAGNEGSGFVAEAEENLEVSNMLLALRQYTLCEGSSLGNAITLCAGGGGIVCGEDACTVVRDRVPELVGLYGWEEDSYMFSLGGEVYSPKVCVGDSIAEEYVTSGVSVSLVYCYS